MSARVIHIVYGCSACGAIAHLKDIPRPTLVFPVGLVIYCAECHDSVGSVTFQSADELESALHCSTTGEPVLIFNAIQEVDSKKWYVA